MATGAVSKARSLCLGWDTLGAHTLLQTSYSLVTFAAEAVRWES